MFRFLSIYIVCFFASAATAKSYEYELPFHRAQAWAEFFILELNNEILKVGLDGQFSSSHYKLPMRDGCHITALSYRPIVPMGQLLINYEVHCGEEPSLVTLVKLEKVGTSVKQIFALPYSSSDPGPALWQDNQLVMTARGMILIFDHNTMKIIYYHGGLDKKFQAVQFVKLYPTADGYRFLYDTGVAKEPRKYLCLKMPEGPLAPCK